MSLELETGTYLQRKGGKDRERRVEKTKQKGQNQTLTPPFSVFHCEWCARSKT